MTGRDARLIVDTTVTAATRRATTAMSSNASSSRLRAADTPNVAACAERLVFAGPRRLIDLPAP